jgi:phage terminase Nu1 subunit (DNA packaging protein)
MAGPEPARLPAGVADAVLNRRQLADAFNTSENTIDAWIGKGMPVLERGSNGRSYSFQLSDCWAWRQGQRQAEQERTEQAEHAVRQLRLMLLGGSAGDDGVRALSPKERAELYAAETQYTRLLQARGELIPAAEVAAALEGVFDLVRAAILAMPDRLARELSLDGAQVERAVRIGDDILANMVAAAGQLAARLEPVRENEPA